MADSEQSIPKVTDLRKLDLVLSQVLVRLPAQLAHALMAASVLEAHPHYRKSRPPQRSADGGLGEAPTAPRNPFASALKGTAS
jgi:hypothetical protein